MQPSDNFTACEARIVRRDSWVDFAVHAASEQTNTRVCFQIRVHSCNSWPPRAAWRRTNCESQLQQRSAFFIGWVLRQDPTKVAELSHRKRKWKARHRSNLDVARHIAQVTTSTTAEAVAEVSQRPSWANARPLSRRVVRTWCLEQNDHRQSQTEKQIDFWQQEKNDFIPALNPASQPVLQTRQSCITCHADETWPFWQLFDAAATSKENF